MTRYAFIADVHLDNHRAFATGGAPINSRAQLILDCLSRVVGVCRSQYVDMLVLLGDTFDRPRPHPALIAEVMRKLTYADTAVLVGNHDRASAAQHDHACAPLGVHAHTYVVDQPRVIASMLALPYTASASTLRTWMSGELVRARKRVVAMHVGITDDATPEHLRSDSTIGSSELFAIMQAVDADLIVAGDWHRFRRWDQGARTIIQVGALCPTGFDNAGVGDEYGNVIVYDTADLTVTRVVVPGPRFVVIAGPNGVEQLNALYSMPASESQASALFVRWTVPPERFASACELAHAWMTECPRDPVCGVDVVPDASLARDDVRRTVAACRAATTLEDAVRQYVTASVLAAGVDPAHVIDRALAYLRSEPA